MDAQLVVTALGFRYRSALHLDLKVIPPLVQPHAQPFFFFFSQHKTLPEQLDVRRQQIFKACAEQGSPAGYLPT